MSQQVPRSPSHLDYIEDSLVPWEIDEDLYIAEMTDQSLGRKRPRELNTPEYEGLTLGSKDTSVSDFLRNITQDNWSKRVKLSPNELSSLVPEMEPTRNGQNVFIEEIQDSSSSPGSSDQRNYLDLDSQHVENSQPGPSSRDMQGSFGQGYQHAELPVANLPGDSTKEAAIFNGDVDEIQNQFNIVEIIDLSSTVLDTLHCHIRKYPNNASYYLRCPDSGEYTEIFLLSLKFYSVGRRNFTHQEMTKTKPGETYMVYGVEQPKNCSSYSYDDESPDSQPISLRWEETVAHTFPDGTIRYCNYFETLPEPKRARANHPALTNHDTYNAHQLALLPGNPISPVQTESRESSCPVNNDEPPGIPAILPFQPIPNQNMVAQPSSPNSVPAQPNLIQNEVPPPNQELAVAVAPPVIDLTLPRFPVTSKNVLDILDSNLDSDNFRKLLVKRLSGIGGKNLEDATRKILSHIMTPQVGSGFNYCGRGAKTAFENYALKGVILEAVNANYNATEYHIKIPIQKWFQNCNKYGRSQSPD